MSAARVLIADVVRAFAVLALVFLSFGTGTNDPDTVVSLHVPGQTASIVVNVCGGTDQQAACHAPCSGCRPDLAILPPPPAEAEPAFLTVAAIIYEPLHLAPVTAQLQRHFEARAPPV